MNILGFAIDHSFLTYKKELKEYGYEVSKISMKRKTVIFNKIEWKITNLLIDKISKSLTNIQKIVK